MKSFASDNYSGIHPEILDAIQHANTQHEYRMATIFIPQKHLNSSKTCSEM